MDTKEPTKPEPALAAAAGVTPAHAHNAVAAVLDLQRAIIGDYERTVVLLRAQLAQERTRAARLEGELAGARKALDAWREVMKDGAEPSPNPGVRSPGGGE